MAELADLSTTDAANTARWGEGQTIPTLNDGGRALEGMIARAHKDRSAYTATSGTGSAYTIITSSTYLALATGIVIVFRAHVACLDNPTLQINSLAAKRLRRQGNRRIRPGDIALNQIVTAVYNTSNDNFETDIGNASLGTFTVATLPTTEVVAGDIAYASNGRKNGEGAGSGTGVLVFRDGTAWRACDTGATVAS